MAKYLIKGNYEGDGIKGLMAKGGTKRREAASRSIESVGGTLDCLYYAFGDTDLYGICDLPDVASATAISLLINSTGALSLNFTPLMTVKDIDAAMTKSPSYQPAGGCASRDCHGYRTLRFCGGPGRLSRPGPTENDDRSTEAQTTASGRWAARAVQCWWRCPASRRRSGRSSRPTRRSARFDVDARRRPPVGGDPRLHRRRRQVPGGHGVRPARRRATPTSWAT